MNLQNISYFSVSSVFKTSRQRMRYGQIQEVLDMCALVPKTRKE